ncbi:MAG TPA: valine--tRNA ligase [Bacteroidetes bacterium]|nr:valine--tRNA ligase [Bacteroidota bacterium]
MEIPPKYDPSKTEEKWYRYWMKQGFFHSEPDEREPYTIVIPPPNVTGVLHMGHMLNNTIQDILVRRARMLGYNTLWVPGTDHASIATEARVVGMLREKGIRKSDLTREEFLNYAWEWKEKHGGIILEQLKKLGASCDWDRTRFTMDPDMSESVIRVFVYLYRKGYIYRGWRMVNWDPQAKTAISDEEVVYRELQSKLYYVKYKVEGSDEWLTVATTRPETILGDTAVCVHPDDERYTHLVGRKVVVPMVNRRVPVIADHYVDPGFGTGALKVTPAHDENDYEIGLRHQLEVIDIFNDDGTLSTQATLFVGEDRFAARELAEEQLRKEGVLEKVEDYVNKVGFSERTDVPIEPRLSQQWFLRMKELAQPALEHVMNNHIRLHPAKFKNVYRHWMENVRDWCISRQLWWGHRIPAWYYRVPGENDQRIVVAADAAEALELARKESANPSLEPADLHQDEDVLDTWFSSWLWPISVFDGVRNPDNPDFKYYYPTNDLVTAPEILFFWVARMIIAGYEFAGEKPFHHVYLTGIVRDKLGRKMSKSLGNSPEPLELIKKYGADGVRVGMLLCSPAGNDLLFDESLTEQGRNFGNKIWNAFRLVKSWKVDRKREQPEYSRQAAEWFESRIQQSIHLLNRQFAGYKLSEALMNLYRLFWDEFSSWYLEIVKPGFQEPVDGVTMDKTLDFLEQLIILLHPFMPFITEEIWQRLRERKQGESVMAAPLPRARKYDAELVERVEKAKQTITTIRSIRKQQNIPQKKSLELLVRQVESEYDNRFGEVLKKLGNLSDIRFIDKKPEKALSFMVKTTEFYIPVGDDIDLDAERKKVENELEYTRGFLDSVMKKLNNRKFMENAPERVVRAELNKKADAEARIRALEEKLAGL